MSRRLASHSRVAETHAPNDDLAIIVASLDPSVQDVWATLRDEGVTVQLATCSEEAAEFLQSTRRHLLVLDADLPGEDRSELHQLAHQLADLPILWVWDPSNGEDPHGGCSMRLEERMLKPLSTAVLVLRIKALALQAGLEFPTRKSDIGAGHVNRPVEHDGSFIAVYGAKGGVGKSTVAVNLAVCLAQSFNSKVLLADADLWYGDVGVLLDVRSDKSLFDICSGTEVDLFGLPKAVIPHSLGPSLLLRPHDPRQVERVNSAIVAKSLRTYCALYDYVLADTGPTLDEINLEVLQACDRILLVTTPELASIHNCVRFLDLAETLGYVDKVQLVVNRANSGVNIEALQRTLGIPVFGRLISSGKLVVDAANHGTSVFALDPEEHDPFTRNLVALAEGVAGKARPQFQQTTPVAATARWRSWLPRNPFRSTRLPSAA